MVSQFKLYNKKYRKLAGTALKFIMSYGGHIAKSDIDSIEGWEPPHEHFVFREGYSREQIRWVVYESSGSVEWQKFRVRLKGLNTKEKLYALSWWFGMCDEAEDVIRVNNYLGALKRSGHLDSNLKVSKL